MITATATAALACIGIAGVHAATNTPTPQSPAEEATVTSENPTAPQPSQEERDEALAAMRATFSDIDAAAEGLEPGGFTEVGEYNSWPAYVVRTEKGDVTVALGHPLVMDRVACPFGASGLMETVGIAGLDAFRTVAPEGAPYVVLGGHNIPLDIADLYTSTGDIRKVEDEMRARNVC